MGDQYPPHEQLLEEPLEDENCYKEDVNIVEVELNQDIEKGAVRNEQEEKDIIRIMRNYGQQYPRNFGKYCVFKFNGNEPSIAIGPHCKLSYFDWPLFLITYIVLIFAGYKLIDYTITYFTGLYISLSIGATFILLISYMTTALVNPGIASAQYEILNEEDISGQKRYCKPCQILRPKGTTHCYDCDVCIKEYDHHCPWTGKCIGKGNLQVFYIFLFSIMTFMIYFMILIFIQI